VIVDVASRPAGPYWFSLLVPIQVGAFDDVIRSGVSG
jgi:hypothetical protein